jgi:hypothetical protein
VSRKPTTAAGYPPELAEEARGLCLYVATILGDLWDDVVVIGGLVPYLIVDQQRTDIRRHVGTRDLDLGLSIAVLDEERYKEISQRLRERGFHPEANAAGNPTRQTWGHAATQVTVDFLIAPTPSGSKPGRLQNLEPDLAAIVTPALPLAFTDAILVTLDGNTPTGERAKRDVQVCGPAAFVILKAFALRLRGENKDAYDLVYMLENYGGGVGDVVHRFGTLAGAPEAGQALVYLAEDFSTPEHIGPKRRANFIAGTDDAQLQAEAFGLVATFLRGVGRPR